jgi:predicted SprT family Zn-dependent metalloprotease
LRGDNSMAKYIYTLPGTSLKFAKFKRRTYMEVFHCHKCRETVIDKEGFRTTNLIYLCLPCGKKYLQKIEGISNGNGLRANQPESP